MTSREALAQAIRECQQRFTYRGEPQGDDVWQTPRETEALGSGDCEDLAVWSIATAWDLSQDEDIAATFYLVAGTAEGGGHAWVELIDEQGVTLWGDPTPGWPKALAPRGAWPTHVPGWAYRWTGHEFAEKLEYAPTP